MTALYRYQFSVLLHSQRYLPPVVAFLALLAVLTSSSTGAILPTYAIVGGLLFACVAWLTIALINTEDPVSRTIAVVNAGDSRRVLGAAVLVALTGSVVLAAIGLSYPIVTGHHTVSGTELLVGVEAQLVCVVVGMGVGLVASRLVIPRTGYSLVVALGLVLALLLVRWISPINPLLTLLNGSRHPADMLLPATGLALIGVVMLLAAAAGTQYVAVRRD
jgi:hypothetical protein